MTRRLCLEGSDLSARERQILVMTGRGQNEREIADTLAISHNTVRAHIQNIKDKLGAENKPHAVVRALLTGQAVLAEMSEIV
jgi:DNA-binding CsgD family transcriptional regulator